MFDDIELAKYVDTLTNAIPNGKKGIFISYLDSDGVIKSSFIIKNNSGNFSLGTDLGFDIKNKKFTGDFQVRYTF